MRVRSFTFGLVATILSIPVCLLAQDMRRSDPVEVGDNPLFGDRPGVWVYFKEEKLPEGRTRHLVEISNLGIEMWINGRRLDHAPDQWRIEIDDGKQGRPGLVPWEQAPWANIRRISFYGHKGFPAVVGFNYSTEDETIRFKRLDWDKGEIEFEFGPPKETMIPCEIKIQKWGASYWLTNLKSAFTRKYLVGEPERIEYRVTDYSYVLDAPFKMEGMQSAETRQWDEMLKRFSSSDKKAWEAFKPKRDHLMKEIMLKVEKFSVQHPEMKGAWTKDFPPETLIAFREIFLSSYRNELVKSKISAQAQKNIMAHLTAYFDRAYSTSKD